MPELTVKTCHADDYVVVTVAGEVDLSCSDHVLRAVVEAVDVSPAPRQACCDLTEVTFIDSTGLSALVAARDASDVAGAEMVLAGARGHVRRVLELTCVGALFREFPTVEDFRTAAAVAR